MIEEGEGATDNVIQISGTPEQAERAQSLLQGFILSSNSLLLSPYNVLFFYHHLTFYSLTSTNFNLLFITAMQPWKRIEECGWLNFISASIWWICFRVNETTICISPLTFTRLSRRNVYRQTLWSCCVLLCTCVALL